MKKLKKLLTTEPVALWGSLQIVMGALLTLGAAFNWFVITTDQQIALGSVYTAITGVVTFMVRGTVQPTVTSGLPKEVGA